MSDLGTDEFVNHRLYKQTNTEVILCHLASSGNTWGPHGNTVQTQKNQNSQLPKAKIPFIFSIDWLSLTPTAHKPFKRLLNWKRRYVPFKSHASVISRSFIKIFLIAEFSYSIILTRKKPVRGLLLWKQKSLQKSSATIDYCNAAPWMTVTRLCNIIQIYCFIFNLNFSFGYIIHNASWDEQFMSSENVCNQISNMFSLNPSS